MSLGYKTYNLLQRYINCSVISTMLRLSNKKTLLNSTKFIFIYGVVLLIKVEII